ncbi:MAG: hypothetical protein ACC657_15680, partial [Thiohalomonadales bacterium]
FSVNAIAKNNIDVLTTISVGAINMDLNIYETFTANWGTFDGDTRDISIKSNIPAAELGVTVLANKFYYGFNVLITGQSVAHYNLSSFDRSNNTTTNTSSQEVTSRSSYSIYTGYSFQDNISLYGGLSFGTGGYGQEVFIDEFGPFIGGRYTFRFGATSNLNFDLSYSFINTETTIRNEDYVSAQYTVTSTNSALSFSTTWLKALDRGRSFFVKLKLINLALDGSTNVEATAGGTGIVTISGNQILMSLSLGMGF